MTSVVDGISCGADGKAADKPFIIYDDDNQPHTIDPSLTAFMEIKGKYYTLFTKDDGEYEYIVNPKAVSGE